MSHRVDFCSAWTTPFVLDYNRYYLHGFSEVTRLTSSTQPWYLTPLPSVPVRLRAARMLRQHVFGRFANETIRSDARHYVGQYVLDTGSGRIRFAIDPHDNRKIASGPILGWCDVYFKSNKWSSEKYPAKVLPLVNGNGVHNRRTLAFLRSLRHAPAEYDVVFISRLGGDVEHNLKLFEALSRLRCRKLLAAVLYPGPEQAGFARQLQAFGVTCFPRNLAPYELWRILARSRINFLRLGAKDCIPWRMIDLLCLGSCVAVDRHPFADWPVPLQERVNFVSCFGKGTAPGTDRDYSRVTDTVAELLDARELVEAIGEQNATYFDRYAAPPRVAEYVVEALATADALDRGDARWSEAVAPWRTEDVRGTSV